jgi:hypothetical protein
MQSPDHYTAKAQECREQAARALTRRDKEDWLKLAADWDATALEANPSGNLPWEVQVG